MTPKLTPIPTELMTVVENFKFVFRKKIFYTKKPVVIFFVLEMF